MERKSIGVKKRLGLPALLTLTYFIVSFGREILCIILTGIGTLMAIMAVFMINSNPKSAIALLFLLIIYIVEIFVKHKSKTKG